MGDEGTAFALHKARRPSRGSDDRVKWQSHMQWAT